MNAAHPKLRGVYAITDPDLLSGGQLIARCRGALSGGVSLLQYRNKLADETTRQNELKALLRLCRQWRVPLLVNDDVSLCLSTGADGVHLGQSDTTVAEARQRLGPQAIIGATCHASVENAQRARAHGASYVAVGRFFPSQTKPEAPPATLDNLATIRAAVDLPIVAIGGVNADNGASLISAGADMLAVIHYLFSTPAVAERARSLNTLFQRQS